MRKDDLENLPLSRFEEKLKMYYRMRPDIAGRILNPNELAEYIRWMATEYIHSTRGIDYNPGLKLNLQVTEMGMRLLTNPTDQEAREAVFSNFGHQNEQVQFLADHDISLNRMYRYMPTHWHSNEYFEIYYALSDNCSVHFTDEVIHMSAGTVLIIPPTVIHASPCYQDDCILMYFLLRSSTFEHVFWNQLSSENLMSVFFRKALENEQASSYLQFDTNNDVDIKELFYRLNNEYEEHRPYQVQMLNTLMSEFLILLLRRYESTAKLPSTGNLHWKPKFSMIFSYIQKHFATTNLSEIAELFHYSERQISRIVLNCTGQTFSELLLKLRMEKAIAMLRQQNASMELIAATVGYSTLSSFYRAFVKYYGCTPGNYCDSKTT